MTELFEELIAEILIRLPVKLLLRFRCVSKSWCTMIDGQQFRSNHLQYSVNTQTKRQVIFSDPFCSHPFIYSLAFDDEVFDKPLRNFKNLITFTEGYKIVGSCNGLLCLSHLHKFNEVVLWNPSARRYKKLPTGVSRARGFECRYEFGYDHVSNDYKVVRIIQFYGNEVEVYSLRLNSWKRVKDLPDSGYKFVHCECFVNGALHWLVYPGFDVWRVDPISSWLIVAFNLGVEEFDVLTLPNTTNRHYVSNAYNSGTELEDLDYYYEWTDIGLAVLEGCLSFIHMYGRCIVDVWMMKQYGESKSWSKLHVLKLKGVLGPGEAYCAKVLAYSKNGKKLLLEVQRNRLSWYDLSIKR